MKRETFIFNLLPIFLVVIMIYGYYESIPRSTGGNFLIIPVGVFWLVTSTLGLLEVFKTKSSGQISKWYIYLTILYSLPFIGLVYLMFSPYLG